MFSLNPRPSFRPRSVLSILMLSLWVVIFVGSGAFAQTVTGTISGTVTDPNGAVVAGANVALINDQTYEKRDLPTNESAA